MKTKNLSFFLALALASCGCTQKIYVDGNGRPLTKKAVQEFRALQQQTTRFVGYQDLKTWSKGTLETGGLVGCYSVLGFFEKEKEKFGLLSHYQPSNICGHLYAIKEAKNLWPIMQNYDSAVIIAFKLNERYIGKNDGGKYIENYKTNFQAFVEELRKIFPNAKILGYNYKYNETIKFNIDKDYFITKTAKDSINLHKIVENKEAF